MKRSISDKLYRRLQRQLGPAKVLDLLSEIAEEANTFKLAKDYELSLWDIRLLRLDPNAALRYALDIIANRESNILPFENLSAAPDTAARTPRLPHQETA